MDILNVASAIRKMSVSEIIDLIFGNYYRRIGFSKKTVIFNEKSEKNISNCLQLN